ncbi:MAG: methyltransferase domain-containing protein [Pseudomonadota bacterium]
MNIDTFFTDHWREIEDERVARYEEMFVWHDAQAELLQPAALASGQRVLDLGCGPGFFAGGLAGLVAPDGRVDGVDINARFVADASSRHADNPRVAFHHLQDHRLPFADATFDRVICKNVLEYVPDLTATLGEVVRVLIPGGRVQVIDSDWGFVIVQPWEKAQVDRFFAAAAPAFNEPFIGRKAPGLLHAAGLTAVKVRLSPFVDQAGRGLHVLKNMASYITTFDTLPADEVQALLDAAADALARERFLFCLPQFLITADKL